MSADHDKCYKLKKKTLVETGPKTQLNENDDNPPHQFHYEIN